MTATRRKSSAVLLTAILFTAFMILFGVRSVHAETQNFEYEGFTVTYEDGVMTFDGTGDIPAVGPYAAPWESVKDGVTKIVVNEGITGLGDYVLYGFKNVVEVDLPASLTTMPSRAAAGFYLMAPLTTIRVAEGSESYCVSDGVLYSKDMTRLVFYPRGKTDTEFAIPEGVKTIGIYGIVSNRNLTKLILPASLTEIESQGIVTLANLTEYVVAEGSESFTVQDGILYTKDMTTVITCPLMKTGAITLPDTVTTLTASCFANTNITSIDLNNVKGAIPQQAFYRTSSLTAIEIPEGVTSIGVNAFTNSGIKEAVLPESVALIDQEAFTWDYYLERFTILNPDCEIRSAALPNDFDNYETSDGRIINLTCVIVCWEGSTTDKALAADRTREYLVNVPTGQTLTYSGKAQTGVVAGTGYTLSGTASATNAGSYQATATLKEGYAWSDGSSDPKTISWKINAKAITPAVTLSAAAYTYNGKVQKPTVTVKDGSTKLAASQYDVTYASGRKNVGTYKMTVKMKGNYSGSKTVTFKINPKGTSLSKVTKAKKAATVKWTKQSAKMSSSRITGYQIQLATNSKFTKNKKTVTVKGYSKTSKKVTGLKGGKKYWVKIRTYKTVNGTKYYSPWSKVKTVKTKK